MIETILVRESDTSNPCGACYVYLAMGNHVKCPKCGYIYIIEGIITEWEKK